MLDAPKEPIRQGVASIELREERADPAAGGDSGAMRLIAPAAKPGPPLIAGRSAPSFTLRKSWGGSPRCAFL